LKRFLPLLILTGLLVAQRTKVESNEVLQFLPLTEREFYLKDGSMVKGSISAFDSDIQVYTLQTDNGQVEVRFSEIIPPPLSRSKITKIFFRGWGYSIVGESLAFALGVIALEIMNPESLGDWFLLPMAFGVASVVPPFYNRLEKGIEGKYAAMITGAVLGFPTFLSLFTIPVTPLLVTWSYVKTRHYVNPPYIEGQK
jgi:hypothetical protein